jgi:S-adenosylmethionine:tRNA ribosyltransferase-isomerase
VDLFKTSEYSFHLPECLIAAEPLEQRDHSRLLVVHKRSRVIEHRFVHELPDILDSRYILVANNTKVIRARLNGERIGTGGKVEFFLLKKIETGLWSGLMKTGARVQPGFEFRIPKSDGQWINATVEAREETTSGVILTARFSEDPVMANVGEVPLPPYIVAKRKIASADELKRYNTVFGTEEGSVAAPTAGRHFTPELIERLKQRGIQWEELTLHVGLGTFKPVSTSDLRDHQMHEESVDVLSEVAERITKAKREGKKILAIGTTSTRTLEGRTRSESESFELLPGPSSVNLFIHPGKEYSWKAVDAMLTNFHLPESTLLMMVASFIGDLSFTLEVYRVAIAQQYRFYSYGDAMLILDQ